MENTEVVRTEEHVGQISTVLDISGREIGGECESRIDTNQMNASAYSTREYRIFDSNESFQIILTTDTVKQALIEVSVKRSN